MKKVQHILYAIIVPAICLVMSSCGKNGKMSLGDERDYSDALFARGKLASIDIKVSENTWQKILSKASDKNYYECSVTTSTATTSTCKI